MPVKTFFFPPHSTADEIRVRTLYNIFAASLLESKQLIKADIAVEYLTKCIDVCIKPLISNHLFMREFLNSTEKEFTLLTTPSKWSSELEKVWGQSSLIREATEHLVKLRKILMEKILSYEDNIAKTKPSIVYVHKPFKNEQNNLSKNTPHTLDTICRSTLEDHEESLLHQREIKIQILYRQFLQTVECVGTKNPDDIGVKELSECISLVQDAKLSQAFISSFLESISTDDTIFFKKARYWHASVYDEWSKHPRSIEAWKKVEVLSLTLSSKLIKKSNENAEEGFNSGFRT